MTKFGEDEFNITTKKALFENIDKSIRIRVDNAESMTWGDSLDKIPQFTIPEIEQYNKSGKVEYLLRRQDKEELNLKMNATYVQMPFRQYDTDNI